MFNSSPLARDFGLRSWTNGGTSDDHRAKSVDCVALINYSRSALPQHHGNYQFNNRNKWYFHSKKKFPTSSKFSWFGPRSLVITFDERKLFSKEGKWVIERRSATVLSSVHVRGRQSWRRLFRRDTRGDKWIEDANYWLRLLLFRGWRRSRKGGVMSCWHCWSQCPMMIF